ESTHRHRRRLVVNALSHALVDLLHAVARLRVHVLPGEERHRRAVVLLEAVAAPALRLDRDTDVAWKGRQRRRRLAGLLLGHRRDLRTTRENEPRETARDAAHRHALAPERSWAYRRPRRYTLQP